MRYILLLCLVCTACDSPTAPKQAPPDCWVQAMNYNPRYLRTTIDSSSASGIRVCYTTNITVVVQ